MTHILTLPNGDIIREGEYGVTRDGQKVGPIVRGSCAAKYWVSTDLGLANDYTEAWFSCGSCWPEGHDMRDERTKACDIVAKWVAEPAAETGTLAELKVQIGDVVVMIGDADREHMTIKQCPPRGKYFADHWEMEGKAGLFLDERFQIISRATPPLPYGHVKLSDGSIWDMTAERQYPFGMLTGDQQVALQAHGGPFEFWNIAAGWRKPNTTSFHFGMIYRVIPNPTRVTVTHPNLFMSDDGMLWYHKYEDAFGKVAKPVTVTYDTIAGVIDYATYKVEARCDD